MITAIVAFIDAKYNAAFVGLFLGTVMIDIALCLALAEILGKEKS